MNDYVCNHSHIDLNDYVCKHYLNEYVCIIQQRLDPTQMNMLVSHSGAELPLWLAIGCEELRVYGDFRTLSKKIELLPNSLEGLLQEVLDRLINEDDTKCMNKVFIYDLVIYELGIHIQCTNK